MATLTLAFDPTVDEYDDLVGLLDDIYGTSAEDSEANTPEPTKPEYPDNWTLGKMRRYYRLLTEDGQTVLQAIAHVSPNGITKAALMELHPRLAYPPSFAGAMSTFGHARNNVRGVHARPFSKRGEVYSMSEPLAELVTSVVAEEVAAP